MGQIGMRGQMPSPQKGEMVMREATKAYISKFYGEEETEQWLNTNRGEEELAMAMTINQWQEDFEYEEDEEAEPIPAEILAWARSITDAKR